MTYIETIDFLYQQLPMYSRIGAAAYKKNLTNTIKLCEVLRNPHQKFKSIHIAGTNGKGSTSHMLAAILQEAGYKVGLYTSPHLRDFRERIRINGEMVIEDFVIQFVKNIKNHIDIIRPSFFELSVAMAFEYFAQQQVDIAVIEVGLGGRLDSTNIIQPILSIITNIGYDHTQMLGSTLPEIAYEKAGIIKSNSPVIIGTALPETKSVFERQAASVGTPIIFAEEERYVANLEHQPHQLIVEVKHKYNSGRTIYHLDLLGIYQVKNLLPVLEAIHQLQLQGWKISTSIIQKALTHVKKLTGLRGRWEVIHEHPTIVLDVAHNRDGIKQIVEQLEITTYHQLHIIIGMVKDKDIDSVLQLLPKHATYYFTKAKIPRALSENFLADKAKKFNLQGKSFTEVNVALKDALTHAKQNDLILVCGSVFVVGEVGK